jgi:pantothenate synthetase
MSSHNRYLSPENNRATTSATLPLRHGSEDCRVDRKGSARHLAMDALLGAGFASVDYAELADAGGGRWDNLQKGGPP